MFPDNTILDILISLVLIYALLSILVSILLEWWNHKQRTRAKFLRKAIFQLLHDPLNVHYGELFYNHYLIEGFRNKELKTSPQYISSQLFAEVLIDIIANRKLHDTPVTMTGFSEDMGKQYQLTPTTELGALKRFENELKEMNPSPFADTLNSFWQKSEGDYEKLKSHLSFWFDDYMDRVSGWYKTKQRTKLMVFGFIVAIGLNVDSLHLIKILSLDDTLRNKLVTTAQQVADDYTALADSAKQDNRALIKIITQIETDSITDSTKRIKHVGEVLQKKYTFTKKIIKLNDSIDIAYLQRADSVLGIAAGLNIPIGWDENAAPLSWRKSADKNISKASNGILAYNQQRNTRSPKSALFYFVGIIISGVSLSFGAPFWFETLVKLINIRRAGKKPEAINTKTK